MGFQWDESAFNQYGKWIEGIPDAVLWESEQLVENAAEEGARVQEVIIATSGTGFENRSGRVVTGKMLDAVGSTRATVDNTTVSAEFGWIDNTEDYFAYQDQGFWHVWANRTVEGMHSLASGMAAAREKLYEGVDKILRRL
jgi:hypothetical protein